ncbi:MAG: hypothetical protein Q8M31_02860 [Beijerinckiaceae bacterium]|nr:hypothetical protein [Beijerinckiaceae bacterium]
MRNSFFSVLSCAFLICLSVGAQALECPTPQSAAKPGVIVEAEAVIAEMMPLLAQGDATQRASGIVAYARKRFPTAQPGEIVNFLITAYCPVANGQNISEADKQTLVNNFATAVTRQLY